MPEPFIAESQAKVGEECIAIDTYVKLKWPSSQFDGLPLKLIISENYSKKYLDTPSSQHISWTGTGKKGVDLPWVKEMLNLHFEIVIVRGISISVQES